MTRSTPALMLALLVALPAMAEPVPAVVPEHPVAAVGEPLPLGATDLTAPVTWESSDPAVASVDGDGVLSCAALGWTTITATDAYAATAATVAFCYPAAPTFAVTPAEPQTVPAGATLQLAATGAVSWWVLDPALGSVDDAGLFTATGTATAGAPDTTRVVAMDAAGAVAVSGPITVPWDDDGDGLPDAWEVANGLDPAATDAVADADGDGLGAAEELAAGTHPGVADTDGDLLPDGWELANGLDPTVPDALGDPDDDGLDNLREYLNGRDPQKSDAGLDADGDGMDDVWELKNAFDPSNPVDSWGDPDADGIVTGIERLTGTDPRASNDNLPDSDGDWMPDAWEAAFGTDPAKADHAADADGDGHTAYLEYLLGTHPLAKNGALPDADGDGMPDYWERTYGLDPATDDAAKDADADGRPNGIEYRDATNPRAADADVDGDSMGDRWEHGFALTEPLGNPDNDHLTNVEEYQLGKNPLALDPYSVTVDPSAYALEIGGTVALTCTNAIGPCTWTTDAATVVAVDTAGVVTGLAPGIAVVKGRDTNEVKGVAVVAVNAPPGGSAAPLGVQPAAAELTEGERVAFAFYGGERPYESIASSDPDVVDLELDVAQGGALAGTGWLVAGRAGAAQVTATGADGATAVIDVVVAPAVVEVDPSALSLDVGTSGKLRASGGTPPYAWTVADPEVASVNPKSGVVMGLSAGATTVTVTDAHGRAASAPVTVTNPPLSLAPDVLELRVGDGVELVPIGGVPPYTWETSDEAVAAVDEGQLEALAAGDVVITVRDAAGQQGKATITVQAEEEDGEGGCAAGRGPSTLGALLALLGALVPLALIRRRRRGARA